MARIGLRRNRNAAAPAPPPPPPPSGQPAAAPQPTAGGQPAVPSGQPAAGAQPGTAQQPAGAQPAVGARPAGGAQPAAGQPLTGARRARPTSPRSPQAAGTSTITPPRPTLEGLRAWLATLDRKVGLRTYLGVAALILALATSAVAIVLAIDARDNSADNDDLNEISARVNELDEASAIDPTAIEGLEARLTAIEDQLSEAGGGDTGARLDVLEGDIEELRDQISELESGSNP